MRDREREWEKSLKKNIEKEKIYRENKKDKEQTKREKKQWKRKT